MNELSLRIPLAITSLTIAAGILDSLAFTYSSAVWQSGRLQWDQVGKAAIAFALGITAYWLSIRYLNEAGVVLPEIQTLIWFAVTIIGVMVLSGRFLSWPWIDQIVAVFSLFGLGWLIVRTAA